MTKCQAVKKRKRCQFTETKRWLAVTSGQVIVPRNANQRLVSLSLVGWNDSSDDQFIHSDRSRFLMTPPDPRVLRAIDANLNRANEALRVIEDCLRFVVEDAHLTSICKSLRHRLGVWSQQLDRHDCIRMRNAADDVGRVSQVETEYHRSHIWDVLCANTQRAEQALRALEEFAKTLTPSIGSRYRTPAIRCLSIRNPA